ncbi:Alpha/Beta hydrolase protein [Aspergillus cavernicola]|uniref:Alpha/Beta hydrolase protein n=1 Tax=Aspergillus cavernicola TaxID=176166 RepID=A0ABR4I9B4_9EURO
MSEPTLEPHFSLADSTPRSSKTTLVIGGLRVYIYGLEGIKEAPWSESEIAVLYLAHGRTLTYLSVEGIAHEILHQYRSHSRQKKVNLIAVTLDMSNHGEREISVEANQGWNSGNEKHAQDMLSIVSASAHDFQLLIDYLPAYLPVHFSKFYNIIAGVSLGGHTAWRIAQSLGATKVHGIAPIVGSPNLTGLMVNRLGVDPAALNSVTQDLYSFAYKDLAAILNEEQKRRWPESLSNVIQAADRAIAEDFPRDIAILAQNGGLDPLVPNDFTARWMQHYEGRDKTDYFVQQNTGHTFTKEMVANIAGWLVGLFAG